MGNDQEVQGARLCGVKGGKGWGGEGRGVEQAGWKEGVPKADHIEVVLFQAGNQCSIEGTMGCIDCQLEREQQRHEMQFKRCTLVCSSERPDAEHSFCEKRGQDVTMIELI